jgi:hypothetical protein
MERTLWVRQENERRKGRKGRKPPATIRRVGFVNDINHLDGRCGRRFAPLGMAETGGNSLQKLCSRNCPEFCCLSQGVHPKEPIGVTLAEIAEIVT